jgi:hypothetical protein
LNGFYNFDAIVAFSENDSLIKDFITKCQEYGYEIEQRGSPWVKKVQQQSESQKILNMK